MSEQLAKAIAAELGGSARQSGGGIWVVEWRQPDGQVVVMGGDGVELYEPGDYDTGHGRSQGIDWN